MGRTQAHGSATMQAALALCFATVGWSVGAPHAHADAGLTLAWSAPEACPPETAVRAELLRLLGGDATAGAGVHVDAQVAMAADARFVLTLVVRTEAGDATRTLEGMSCDALMQAGALVVALAVDPEGVAARAEVQAVTANEGAAALTAEAPPAGPVDADPVAPEPAAAGPSELAPPPSHPAPETRARRGPRLHARVLAHVVGEALAVPGVSVGFAAGAGLRVGIIDLTLEALWTAPRHIAVPAPAGAGAGFTLIAARVRGCIALTGSVLELAPCVGFELGSLRGESLGVSAPAAGSTLWVAPFAGLELRVFVHDLVALTARFDGAFPLRRPAFVIAGVGAVTELGLASVRGEIGASLYFP